MPDRTVLVVDDNDDSRRMIKLLLSINGCDVIEASDGEKAVRLAREQHPQVILMDLKMPGMDGFEAIRKIRSFDSEKRIPIVVLSAYATDPEWKKRALEEGADICLVKPNDVERLKDVLLSYLPPQTEQDTSLSFSTAGRTTP